MAKTKPSESAIAAINEIAETYWAEYDFCPELLQHCANIIDKHRPPEEKHPMYAVSRDKAGVEHIERVETPKEKAASKLLGDLQEVWARIVIDEDKPSRTIQAMLSIKSFLAEYAGKGFDYDTILAEYEKEKP